MLIVDGQARKTPKAVQVVTSLKSKWKKII
jgi:hypothetical protein